MDDQSAELLARWRHGDQQAARALFERYAEGLIGVARRRLSDRLARRLDPEDVVQSAYRSFFQGAREGRYLLHGSGDLWRLLVVITLHKLHKQVERHTARKRGLDREQDLQDTFGLEACRLAGEPTPVEAAALAEELERVMTALDPLQRRMLESWLQGGELDAIAADVQRSQRTVRRVLEMVQKQLEESLLQPTSTPEQAAE